MAFTPEFQKYIVFVRHTTTEERVFPSIEVVGSEHTDLSDEVALGRELARIAIEAGLLDDPAILERGLFNAIGIAGTNDYNQNVIEYVPLQPTRDDLATSFFEAIQAAQTPAV